MTRHPADMCQLPEDEPDDNRGEYALALAVAAAVVIVGIAGVLIMWRLTT